MLATLRRMMARQVARHVMKLLLLSLTIATGLHFAPPLIWLPVSLLAAIGLRYLISLFYNTQTTQLPSFPRRRNNYLCSQCHNDHHLPPSPPPQVSKTTANMHWRQNVQSSVVEHAWDTLCGSIVQEFIYDSWFAMLSPDREFPSEIRRLLNHSFGTLSLRARHLDLRIVLEDACEMFMETVELYRDTRESIMIQRPDFLGLPQEAKDALLRREMAAEGNLHPALTSPGGHYKVLRTISDGTVGVLLASEPSQSGKNVAIRAVVRELLGACVLRPYLMYCTPYYANKAMITLLTEQAKTAEQQQQQQGSGGGGSGGGGGGGNAAKQTLSSQQQQQHQQRGGGAVRVMDDDQRAMRGQWEFEQRLLSSAEAEKTPPSTHLPRRVLLGGGGGGGGGHSRSKSVDNALLLLQPTIDEDEDDDDNRSTPKSTSITTRQQQQQAISTATTTNRSTSQDTKDGDSYDDTESEASSPVPPHHRSSKRLMSPFEKQAIITEKVDKVVGSGGLRSHAVPALHLESLTSSAQRDESDTHLIAPSVVNSTRIIDSSRSMTSNVATAAAVAAAKYLLQNSNGSNGGRAGFTGCPRARVVAAELHTSTFKDFVVYKIRVGDDASEWTISRRYRNFESLHRQLLVYSAYRLKLPPKRIFFHAQTVDFVEERREALDKYLQQLLCSRQLAACSDIYEFLNKESEVYELPQATAGGGAAAAVGRSNLGPSYSVGATAPSLGSMPGEVTPPEAVIFDSTTLNDGSLSQQTYMFPVDSTSSTAINGTSTGGLGRLVVGAATKSARRLKTVLSISTIVTSNDDGGGVYAPASHQSQSSAVSSASEDTSVSNGQAFTHHPATSSKDETNVSMRSRKGMRELSQLEEEESINAIKSGTVPPVGPSPSKLGLFSRSKSRPKSASTSRTSSPVRRRHTYPVQPPTEGQELGMNGTLPIAAAAAAAVVYTNTQPSYKNNNAAIPPLSTFAPSTSKPPPIPKSFPAAAAPFSTLDPEDCTGISAPLYEIVDCIFQLQRRGFFRRQVFGMARQVLSLVAGDVIDVFLVNKLRMFTQEHTIARLIHKLQNSLWPGGVWHSYVAAKAAAGGGGDNMGEADEQQATLGKEEGSPLRPAPSLMQSDHYIKPSTPPPPDAEYIKTRIKELMLSKTSSSLPLARLVGKGVYIEGMADLHDMMQSEVFMHQLGYGMLELVLFYVFPELKSMFITLEHGAQQ